MGAPFTGGAVESGLSAGPAPARGSPCVIPFQTSTDGSPVNTWLLAAAAMAFATGLAHTVMGEVLIFRRLRRGTVVPTFGGEVLRERHLRILWASWHVLTLLGWCMAAMLVALAAWPASDMTRVLARLIELGMFAGAMTVLIATRGRHPGWLAMSLVALLIEASR